MDIVSWAAPVAVMASFVLFRWLAPAKVDPSAVTVPLDELERRCRKWEMASVVPVFIFAAITGYGWFFLLRAVGALLIPMPVGTGYVLAQEDAYWGIPAIFLGIVSSAYPTMHLYKHLLRERYTEYQAYTQLRVGFNTIAVFRVFAILVPFAAAGFILGAINYTTVIDEQGITTKTLWGEGGGFHPHSSITAIRAQDYFTAPNGNRVFRPHYVIEFADGTQWTTRDGLRSPDPAYDVRIMQFIAEKSGHGIDRSPETIR